MSIYRLIPAKHLATDPELRDDPFREGVKEKDAAIKRMAWPPNLPGPSLPTLTSYPPLAPVSSVRTNRVKDRTQKAYVVTVRGLRGADKDAPPFLSGILVPCRF